MINEIGNGIFEIKNFISNDTCKYLIKSLSNYLEPDKEGVSGTFGSMNPEYLSVIGDYNKDSNFNISLDILNSICSRIQLFVSLIYNEQHILKQTYYSSMTNGGSNPMHMDNYYFDDNGKILERTRFVQDKSGVLYLNNSYSGGCLNFPDQNLSLKPDPGTLIIFEGNHERKHEVAEVIDGNRCNFITFCGPLNKRYGIV